MLLTANGASVYCEQMGEGSRQVLLLNIRWWDGKSSQATIWRKGVPETVEVPEGVIEVR